MKGAPPTHAPTDLHAVLPNTHELDVSDNTTLKSLEGLGKLTVIERLDASGCGLTAVPDEIENCAGTLTEVLLFANKIKEIPAGLTKLAKLETLNVFNNQIKKLPLDIGKLDQLEELNCAANKLMMLTDAHFKSFASVKILSLYDNNLVRMGSITPMVALEEFRISGNNLEVMPTLASAAVGGHPALLLYEIHKNRIATIADEYFDSTPALERLSLWGNLLTTLPSSLANLPSLIGLQAQGNKLATLPTASWPATLQTVFLQDNYNLTSLPPSLNESCEELLRVNLSNLDLDGASMKVAIAIRDKCIAVRDGIFWGVDGVKEVQP